MEHEGYSITAVKEKSLGSQGDPKADPVTVTSYKVSAGKKIIAVGLPSEAAAKAVVETRRKARTRIGLDPVG